MANYIIDPALRAQIVGEVRRALVEGVEINDEHWLSEEQLMEQFAMFTKGWMRRYGILLPRTQAVVREDDGTEHRTSWCYPRNIIQRMIITNKIQNLELRRDSWVEKKRQGKDIGFSHK